MTRPLIFLLLFLLFCLPACAKQAGPGTSNTPFAATGLLANPDETAEEILIRAHNQDRDAVPLVVAGYTMGIGGFPQDSFLGYLFNNAYQAPGWEDTNQFLYLFNMFTYYSTYYPPRQPMPEECLAAGRSPVAPLFKQAGIFDIDSVCAAVPPAIDSDFTPTGFYHRGKISPFPEMFERSLNRQELERIENEFYALPSIFTPYLRGALVDGQEPTAQQIQKLVQFMALRKADEVLLDFTIPSTDADYKSRLRVFAADAIMDTSSAELNAELIKETIRKAHQGDALAALQMAEYYRTGAFGFPESFDLTTQWLERAASLGSRKAVDNLALLYYAYDDFGISHYAYYAANTALHYGSPELKEIFAEIIADIEKKSSPENTYKLKHNVNLRLEELKKSGYQTK